MIVQHLRVKFFTSIDVTKNEGDGGVRDPTLTSYHVESQKRGLVLEGRSCTLCC